MNVTAPPPSHPPSVPVSRSASLSDAVGAYQLCLELASTSAHPNWILLLLYSNNTVGCFRYRHRAHLSASAKDLAEGFG